MGGSQVMGQEAIQHTEARHVQLDVTSSAAGCCCHYCLQLEEGHGTCQSSAALGPATGPLTTPPLPSSPHTLTSSATPLFHLPFTILACEQAPRTLYVGLFLQAILFLERSQAVMGLQIR